MTHPYVADPWDDAMNAEPEVVAGKISTAAWTCVLVGGVGKVPYDPVAHRGKRRSTAIDITIEPLDPTAGLIQRNMVNWAPSFKAILRPSLETVVPAIAKIRGMQVGQFNPLKEISGLWVVATLVERPDNKKNQSYTTVKIEGVYDTEDACAEAYERATGETVGTGPGVQAAPEAPPVAAQTAGNEAQRAQMAVFLRTIFEQVGHDNVAFYRAIKDNPMLAAHFGRTSPEVEALVAEFDIPF